MDESDIIRLVDTPLALPESIGTLVKISEDTVVKLGRCFDSTTSEALAMDLVRTQTTIPVPRVRRIIPYLHAEGYGLIVMDFIKNARQLHAYYLQQLRRIQHPRSDVPGGLGSSPLPCGGFLFGLKDRALLDYFNKELRLAEGRAARGWVPSPNCLPLDESVITPLVFSHNDLNMRNILLDDDEKLWIVDWGFSGFFPPWFEYVNMRLASQKEHECSSWLDAIQHMAEPDFAMERWIKKYWLWI